eukprot:3543795-Amphidinium_carterae.1
MLQLPFNLFLLRTHPTLHATNSKRSLRSIEDHFDISPKVLRLLGGVPKTRKEPYNSTHYLAAFQCMQQRSNASPLFRPS